MDYANYISPELLALIPVLYALGSVLKSTEKIKDNIIPAILTGVGVALSCLHVMGTEGVNSVSIFTAIVQGVLVSATAVYSNQLIKQATK